MSKKRKLIQHLIKETDIAACPTCKKIVKTPPELDPHYKSYRKWKCEHCGTTFAENFPKASCGMYGLVPQSQCKTCSHGRVALITQSNCKFFISIISPPPRWLARKFGK